MFFRKRNENGQSASKSHNSKPAQPYFLESLEQRDLKSAVPVAEVIATETQDPQPAILVKIPPVYGDATMNDGYDGDGRSVSQYFTADSFSFAIEREMKESGEIVGTGDINIGIGEDQARTASKSMDMASTDLARFAINGTAPGQAELDLGLIWGGAL